MDPYEREMENRCGCNDDGFDEDDDTGALDSKSLGAEPKNSESRHGNPLSVPVNAQQVADDAARRTARASWANTKMLMQAMGVKL